MIVESTWTKKDKETGKDMLDAEGNKITRTYQTEYNFGENLLEMLGVCDAEGQLVQLTRKNHDDLATLSSSPAAMKVYYNSRSRMVIALQNGIRGWLDEELSDDEIDAKVSAWEIPDGAPRAKDPVAKAAAAISNLSNEQLQALLKARGLA